jgi:hypothetical protein
MLLTCITHTLKIIVCMNAQPSNQEYQLESYSLNEERSLQLQAAAIGMDGSRTLKDPLFV